MMLNLIIENTDRFMNAVPKAKRKKYGQFFTNVTTAQYMASLFVFDTTKPLISLLDAGAGTGILSAAVVQKLIDDGYKGHIHITCYETDTRVLSLLEENLNIIKNNANVSFTVKNENYITSQSFGVNTFFQDDENIYDDVIGNPPYLKIPKDAVEAKSMPEICYGAPTLCFLFWARSIFNIKEKKEINNIITR